MARKKKTWKPAPLGRSIAVAGAAWRPDLAGGHLINWTPDRAEYPVQGVLIGTADGAPDFRALKAIGADFAYLEASSGTSEQDTSFARNYAASRKAGLRIGVVHAFDPCVPADGQSANFVTIVPRVTDLLPPAIELANNTDGCETKVRDASVESELMTFINQVENHVGQAGAAENLA